MPHKQTQPRHNLTDNKLRLPLCLPRLQLSNLQRLNLRPPPLLLLSNLLDNLLLHRRLLSHTTWSRRRFLLLSPIIRSDNQLHLRHLSHKHLPLRKSRSLPLRHPLNSSSNYLSRSPTMPLPTPSSRQTLRRLRQTCWLVRKENARHLHLPRHLKKSQHRNPLNLPFFNLHPPWSLTPKLP